MNYKALGLIGGLVLFLGIAACGGGGGGSGGSDDTADANARFAAEITALDQKAVNNEVTDDQFLAELEQLINTIESEPDGVQNLADYLETEVVGQDIALSLRSRESAVTRGALSDTLARIKNTQTYQMIETFVTTVASSLLLPDPVGMLLDLSQPEVFNAFAAVQVRTHIMDAEFSGEITADRAAGLLATNQYNPFDAQRDLLDATGREIPEWLQPYDNLCLRDCGTEGGTGIYSGSFYGTTSETASGCVWEHTVDATITVMVTGSGTLADPYTGTMEVSGEIVTDLSSGTECAEGGVSFFDETGTVGGSSGKLDGTVTGTGGTGTLAAILSNASVSGSVISGTLTLNLDVDYPIVQTVTLIRE